MNPVRKAGCRSVLLLLVLVFSAAGCGGESTGSGPAEVAADLEVREGDVPVRIKPGDALSEPADLDGEGASGDADVPGDAVEPGGDGREEADVSGFDYPCEPLTVESCVTACGSAGKRKCLKEWGPCIPPQEYCGNCADDDCDGLVNEGCPPKPECEEPVLDCPVAIISIAEGYQVGTGTKLHLSAAQSVPESGKIVKWLWTVQAPAGAAGAFMPSDAVEEPTFLVDAAGQYLFSLDVWDEKSESCVSAQAVVKVDTYPPVDPETGCADGKREGFVDMEQYPQVAGCSGGWDQPGVTPETVKQTCGGKGGDDGPNPEGKGCSTADLCAAGWHVCRGWEEVAKKSPTGCAGSTPPDAKPKSLFFAMRQPSFNGSVCEAWVKLEEKAFNDVFGCGNLGAGLGPDKKCGPLDRVLASTQPDTCGFNEAEPPLGPWECKGGTDSHLKEGSLVTKKGCAGGSCKYDGYDVGTADKGGVLCCHD